MPRKPRKPEPFFRTARAAWFVQIGKVQHNLGPDQEAAWKEYYRLMAEVTPTAPDEITVVEVVDRFLKWTKANRKPRTWQWYDNYFKGILEALPAGLLVNDLKAHHVTRCLEVNVGRWKAANSQNAACRAIKRAMNWAAKQEIIARAPLGDMEVPEREARDVWYEADEWSALVGSIDHPDFVTFVTMMRQTGCRPFELRQVTAANYDRENKQWVFKRKSSKGKRYHRKVMLSPAAIRLTEEAMQQYPEGPLFRYHPARGSETLTPKKVAQHYGVAFETVRAWIDADKLAATQLTSPGAKIKRYQITWDALAAFELATGTRPNGKTWGPGEIRRQIDRMEKKLGWRPMVYAIRHTFAVDALKAGVDSLYVAKLLGHRDLSMVAKVYGHIGADTEDMHGRLTQALKPRLGLVREDDERASA
jgi:integrase